MPRPDPAEPSEWRALTGPPHIAAALCYARSHDWLGHQIHTALAAVFLFLLPLATAPKDVAFGLLIIWSIVRLLHTWRSYGLLIRQPLILAIIAWIAWRAAATAWSSDAGTGLIELRAQRMLFLPLLLWPVLDRIPWLIGAALLGVLGQNVVQALQEAGVLGGAGGEGRLPGLLHPIHSGAWFVAAMAWHLSAALHGRGAIRWISLGLLVIAAAGLIGTGSRGPWLAAAVIMPAALFVMALRRRALRAPAISTAFAIIAIMGIIALGSGIISPLASIRKSVDHRLADAAAEIHNARSDHIYWTSAGLRLALWGWAWELSREHPIIGVGAGGFAKAYQALPSYDHVRKRVIEASTMEGMSEHIPGYADALAAGEDVTRRPGYRRGERRVERLIRERIDYIERAHAHSTYLHTLATLGAVGAALLAFMLIAALARAWNDRPDHIYADGSFFVMLAWIIGAQFDCYELNGHQLGLLALAMAATLPLRLEIDRTWRPRLETRDATPRIGK